MTDPTRRPSGEHKAVKDFRKKLESLDENTLEELRDLNRKLEDKLTSVAPTKPDAEDDEDEDDHEETKEGDDHGAVR